MATLHGKMPTFSKQNIKLFFAQLDASFTLNKITDELTKYNYLVNILDSEILSAVSDLVYSVPADNPFTLLKERLLTLFEHSAAQNTKALLQELTLGDQKPSILLRRMKELANGQITDDFLKNIWLQRLPTNIQTVLAVSDDTLDKLALLADKVSELTEPTNTVNAVSLVESNQYKVLQLQITELTKKLDALATATRSRSQSRGRFRNFQRSPSRGRQNQNNNGFCYYHFRFGTQARNCRAPCSFNQGNDPSPSQ